MALNLTALLSHIGYSEVVSTLALILSIVVFVLTRLERIDSAKIYFSAFTKEIRLVDQVQYRGFFVVEVVNQGQTVLFPDEIRITQRNTREKYRILCREEACLLDPGKGLRHAAPEDSVPPNRSVRYFKRLPLSSCDPFEDVFNGSFNVYLKLENRKEFRLKNAKIFKPDDDNGDRGNDHG